MRWQRQRSGDATRAFSTALEGRHTRMRPASRRAPPSNVQCDLMMFAFFEPVVQSSAKVSMLRSRRFYLLLALSLAGLAVAAAVVDWWTCRPPGLVADYVGRRVCAECHAREARAWTGSDHDRAMARATPETVLGDFNDRQFTYQGVTSRMFRKGETFYIHTEGPDGKMADFEIRYTLGVRPLQQYMVRFPDGRVQVLRISWDTQRKRWFYVPPPDAVDQRIEPGDPLHWTGTAQNWNHMCAECHSTNLQKGYDLASDTFHTTFSEIDVSCEACHGPGSLHVDLARTRSLFWDRRYGYGLPELHTASGQIEACAPCHSRRNLVYPGFRPGDRLLDFYEPALLEEGLYHVDGQILDEVYVYGSFLQSRMHREGIRCTDCHDPHSGNVKFPDNRLCTQCHLAGKYDGPVHHHHPVASAGARCVECHMPATKYMVIDPRRDHSLRVPRPDLSVRLGTPNACNRCHREEGETPQWAAEKVVQWYGEKRPDDPHYALALAAGRAGAANAPEQLARLVDRPATPAIVRATAVALLGRFASSPQADATRGALRDADPLVRTAAARSVPAENADMLLKTLGPALIDPIRSVRLAAALRLAGIPRTRFPDQQRRALDEALIEYRRQQLASSDRAAAHLNLGNLAANLGDVAGAMREYRTAIRLEPYLTGPRSNLAGLLEQTGRGTPEEVRRLREQELELLERDVRLLPNAALLRYRYGLMLYLLGRLDAAQRALEAACRLQPASYDFRLFLTLLYEKRGQRDKALASARRLERLRPGDRAAADLIRRLSQPARPNHRPQR